MKMLRNNIYLFWAILSIPAIAAFAGWFTGRLDSMDMLHPTGEWSARFMILAMSIGPLLHIFGTRGWTKWLSARRRYLGVAAFIYAAMHLAFYIIDMGNLADMLAEISAPGIWTAWAAMALMLPMALTSNDRSMRYLKAGWKRLQRLAYPAAILTLLHWGWVHNGFTGAVIHFAPLLLLQMARIIKISNNKLSTK